MLQIFEQIRPVSNETNDSWNGWGVTMIDGLDTAMLMNLDSFVQKVSQWGARGGFFSKFIYINYYFFFYFIDTSLISLCI